jgi:hypothetical protein
MVNNVTFLMFKDNLAMIHLINGRSITNYLHWTFNMLINMNQPTLDEEIMCNLKIFHLMLFQLILSYSILGYYRLFHPRLF